MKNRIIVLIIIICIIIGIYGFFIEPNIITVKQYKIEDSELAGIKIVLASDFHFRPKQMKKLKKITQLINAQNADIVLSVGDFVNGHTDKTTMPIEKIADGLKDIKSKHGFITTLGNHDTYYNKEKVKTALKQRGITVLDNENIHLNINGKTVYITGVADMATDSPMLKTALKNTKNPKILLTHSPDLLYFVPKDVNLTLAGHLHGGQIRIPLFGAIYTPSGYGDKYSKGKLINENGKKMIVTKGLGTSLIHFRFLCFPEIVVIEFI